MHVLLVIIMSIYDCGLWSSQKGIDILKSIKGCNSVISLYKQNLP